MSRLVVIGGVAAGLSAASKARRLRDDLDVVVLEAEERVAFGACSLPYFLERRITEADALFSHPLRFFRDERRLDVRVRACAERLDPVARTVDVHDLNTGSHYELAYDRLVLATGARARRAGVPGELLRGIFTVKSYDDAVAIRSWLDDRRPGSAVVVGAGYLGLESASALAALGVRTTLIEARGGVLGLPEADAVAQQIVSGIRDAGVELRPGERVTAFEGEQELRGVVTARGRYPASLALLCIGFEPAVELARAARLRLGRTGAIATDQRMSTSIDGVYAAGDCCEIRHLVTRQPAYIPLATYAQRAGRVAGENAAGGAARFPGGVGAIAAVAFGLEVGRTGLTAEEATGAGLRPLTTTIRSRSKASYFPDAARVTITLVHDQRERRLLGAAVAGRDVAKRMDVLSAALQLRMTVDDVADLDLCYTPPVSPDWDPVLVAARAAEHAERDA